MNDYLDGKRQRLQRTLESLDPVEFVLPAGRLSAYTEQVLESFVTAQSDSVFIASDSSGDEELRSCIRVERIPNEFFEFSLAKETFSGVFREAESEYTSVVACPSLPKLCVCCFGACGNTSLHSIWSRRSLHPTTRAWPAPRQRLRTVLPPRRSSPRS